MKWLHTVLFILVITSTPVSAAGRFIELQNVQLWVLDTGGAGEPVVLMHPRTGNSEIWQYTLPALAAAGYRGIAVDSPGWGKSVVRPGKDIVPVADTLEELFDHLRLDKVHLVGTAMGGYVVLDYAAWRPERVSSLVIAASGLGLENDPEGDAFRAIAEIPVLDNQPAEVREMSPSYRGLNPEGVARWLAIHEHAEQKGAVRPPLRTPNTTAKVASIKVPTFVIAGGADLTTPSGAIRLWSKHLTVPYEFLVLAEAGHVLVWEQPEVFNKALIEFLQKH
jgi:pimeloyl-ACP methyl ester carboxylesterase